LSLTKLAHNLISVKLKSIKSGIDATCGNGNDTLFLSGLCSTIGIIYSFDIQEEALRNTANALENNLINNVQLIHTGHENILKHIDLEVDVIIFNLGYLPNSDRKISTSYDTTIIALESCLTILRENGIISIICYPKHISGFEEMVYIKQWICDLSKSEFKVNEYSSENSDKTTPILYIFERLARCPIQNETVLNYI